MLLKTLSLAGFKSFADRTRLEFHSGVNVVVGPNGSGKSNLLDALAWVMGTQATTALRTQKMDDVIFAGTTTRPRLGRAEVTLTFDNSDRFLSLDLDEISMTRRLYRDGTSEYLLNGTPCRLLDLHELLSDGGVGRHQHVLVGQGEIGDILSARPDEHRAVIEEAAGVTKHRGRRDRSLRRLEQTDEDIARLGDILDDQRRRLRPLKRQANAAERYDSVRDAVVGLHLWLGGEALRSLAARAEAATAEKAELEGRLARDTAALEELSAGLAALRSAAGAVGRDLERDTAAAARLETLAERLRSIGSVARERRRSLEGRLAGAGERRADLAAELADLNAEIGNAGDVQQAGRSRLETYEAEVAALEEEESALAEQLGLSAEGLVANLRGDLRALETAAERDRKELAALELRIDVVRRQLVSDEEEHGRLVAAIETADVELGRAQTAYEAASEARAGAQARWDEATERAHGATIEFERARARHEAIESALAGEGDPEGRERAAAAPEVLGAVVERLDVPADLGGAVDAALGVWRHALAAAGRPEVRDVAASLRADGLGGVPLVAVSSSAATPDAGAVADEWGVETLVSRLGSDADRALATMLLGDVILVEGWKRGWDLVEKHPELRAVTPEGDVVAASGMILAQADGVGPAALEAAAVALEKAETGRLRSDSAAGTARRAFDSARERERVTLEQLESLEAKVAGHTEALSLIDRARAEHEAELERLSLRDDSLESARAARDERIAALRARLAELGGEDETRQKAWEGLKDRRARVASSKERARAKRDEQADLLARGTERTRLLERRVAAVTAEMRSLDEIRIDPEAAQRLGRVEAAASAARGVVQAHITTLRERQRLLREKAGDADARLASALEDESGLRKAIDHARERLAALTIELTEVEIRTEATAEGLRRDADSDEAAALAAERPDYDEDADLEAELATLEAHLRRMGPVNPLAAQEYQVLADEVALLEAQLDDLEETGRELRKVISALDDKMAALFREAFDDIARMYQENFELVFPGGRGRLVLTDPDKPLDTGVEIHAQPLGKKVGRLSLLSGGERSLAALAFLFAVFRARPSPFYVLDEVEAALDDANLRRFLLLVDTLRRSAQLVIITHQQQTMEAADILYGVTMEPGESSIIVAKRLVDSVTDRS